MDLLTAQQKLETNYPESNQFDVSKRRECGHDSRCRGRVAV